MSTQVWYVLIPTAAENRWKVMLKTANYGYGCGYARAILNYWEDISFLSSRPTHICKVVPEEDCKPLGDGFYPDTYVTWKGDK